ncbi:alpha/beta fold hydrolase [Paucibacter sp. APW11]|uniref:Alpha/beta fold hydrolase n=1 Tax=Roseateles aquae TaxID=3077235 RepID=A0ABU3PHV9_9BURK|nr:alpha/beta fold hydrolase [Paucibacter sp. APW11]MDT9001702.1 alpha/beta fold hydrolase [Paucibacter sp. APW11]
MTVHTSLRRSLSRKASLMLASLIMLTGTAQAQLGERMVDVVGRRLHAISMGQGESTVVFEAGFSMDLSSWRKLVPLLAPEAKLLVYSRAGHGQSDPMQQPPSLARAGADLQAVLADAGLKPPYLLVGHSYGALLIRDFAARHPEQIAGLVFVDPAHEKLDLSLRQIDAARLQAEREDLARRAPPAFRADLALINTLMDAGQLPEPRQLPDVPTAVLSSTKRYAQPQVLLHTPAGMQTWRRLHSEFAAQFSNSLHITTSNSGHFIQNDEPALLADAIRQVAKMAAEQARVKARQQALQALNSSLQAIAALPADAQAEREARTLSALQASALGEADINEIAYRLLGAQQPTLAASLLRWNVQAYPQSDNAADSLGEALLTLGQPAQAEAQFQRALELAAINKRNPRVTAGYQQHLDAARAALKR